MQRPLRRRSVRDPSDDYMHGSYLVTICTHGRCPSLGRIRQGHLAPTHLGGVVAETWQEAVWHYGTVRSEAFVVMPNHVHGVVELSGDADDRHGAGGLGTFVGAFKRQSGRYAKDIGIDGPIWQRSYHDRILRDADAVGKAIGYVLENPANWGSDPLNRTPDTTQGAGVAPTP